MLMTLLLTALMLLAISSLYKIIQKLTSSSLTQNNFLKSRLVTKAKINHSTYYDIAHDIAQKRTSSTSRFWTNLRTIAHSRTSQCSQQ